MVDKQIVLETIRRMRESGITDKVIESTLSDIGLSRDEVAEYLRPQETAGPSVPSRTEAFTSSQPPAEENEPDDPFDDSDADASDDTSPSGIRAPSLDPNEALHTTTHAALEDHGQTLDLITSRLSEMDSKLSRLAQAGSFSPGDAFTQFDRRLSAIESEVSDAKSQLSALRQVMEKLLDTNRDILTELKGKK
jgi:hypothetical protein